MGNQASRGPVYYGVPAVPVASYNIGRPQGYGGYQVGTAIPGYLLMPPRNIHEKKLKQSSIKIKRAPTSIQQSTTQNNSSKTCSLVHPSLSRSRILPSLDSLLSQATTISSS
ncbi:unnamed protein product [Rotaria sordida]|uniref:Uncharacterized protein n=2 Tax=Rotaria sordida TaxID=392033 RepID=A0A814WM97_9BILA|nr:unnamed protein product [Rotaria sordida]